MLDLSAVGDVLWRWLAADTPVVGLALCRIGVAIAVLVDVALLARHARTWLDPRDGVLPADGDDYPETWLFRAARAVAGPGRAVPVALAVHAAVALVALVGAASQVACAALFLTTSALHRRNPHILYGGDGLTRVMLLLLSCSPCGAALSIDAYRSTGGLALDAVAAPWGMRLLQIELCVLYLYNFVLKADMPAWREGLALYFVWRNPDLTNLPVPRPLRTVIGSRIATWGTLAVELALGPGLLVEATRPYFLALAFAFHAAIALTLSVHLFSYLMIAGLCVFLTPHELAGSAAPPTAWGWIGVAVCCAYLGYAVFWDPPAGSGSPTSRAVRRLVRALPRWAPLHRSWRLFIGDPPGAQQLQLRVSVYREARGLEEMTWTPAGGLRAAGPGDVVGHRLRKFIAALTSFPRPRQRFGEYILERAAGADAVMIDVVCDVVAPPAGRERAYLHLRSEPRPVFTRIRGGPGADREELYLEVTRLLDDRPGEASIVGTLLMLGMHRAATGGDDRGYIDRVVALLDRDLGAASRDDIAELRAMCGALADPHRRCTYVSLIDGLEYPALRAAARPRDAGEAPAAALG